MLNKKQIEELANIRNTSSCEAEFVSRVLETSWGKKFLQKSFNSQLVEVREVR